MSEPRKDLDDLLDSALVSYSKGCERIGLQTRILGHLEERTNPAWSFRYLGAAIFVSVCVCCLFLMQRPQPGSVEPQQRPAAVREAKEASTTVQPEIVGIRHARRKRRAEGKLAKFPAPSPLTDEERALLKVARARPAPQLRELGTPINGLAIAELEIKPLE